jgi:molybdate transport system substrate-binding protein
VKAFSSALIFASIFALACSQPARDKPGEDCQRPVRMGVASSLREIALGLREQLLDREEPILVETIFGASSTLARQIEFGAPMDILVSADAEIASDLAQRGLLRSDSLVEIARGRLSLVARTDWPAEGLGLDAIASPLMNRIAVPAVSVPLGRYARSWLENKGLLERLSGKIVQTEHARATLAAVEAGHVDIAIVYETDIRFARRSRLLGPIEPSEYPPIRYVAAIVATAPACAAMNEDLNDVLGAWTHPTTRQRLKDSGFLAVVTREES